MNHIYNRLNKDSSRNSSDFAKDLQDQAVNYTFYEPYWVLHPDNCKMIGCWCTPRKESARLEKARELWWKNRKTSAPVIVAETDYWDPTMEGKW